MDENNERQRFVSRRSDGSREAPSTRPSSPSNGPSNGPDSGGRGNGLLSRYGTSNLDRGPLEREAASQDAPPSPGHRPEARRPSIPAKPTDAKSPNRQGGEERESREGRRGPWQAFGGQARRLGDNFRRAAMRNRQPQAGNWRASDFDQDVLEAWDRHGSVPFELPEDPDAPDEFDDVFDDTYDAPQRRRASSTNYDPDDDWDDDERGGAAGQPEPGTPAGRPAHCPA